MLTPSATSRKPPAAASDVPASFVYRGLRIRWPQERTKRTAAIYSAARKVMNLGPVEPAPR